MQMETANSPQLPMQGNRDPLRGIDTPAAEKSMEQLVREELGRILESRIFKLSTRMKRFLRFVVETTLEGGADSLKEYVIGTEVYDRRPPYEPSQDSIVRTEARRLRNKVKEYYETEGKTDPVIISFRAGSYVPVFVPRERVNSDSPRMDQAAESIARERPEVLVVVMTRDDVSGVALAKDFARAISESIGLQCKHRSIHKSLADLPLQMLYPALAKDPAPH